MATPDGKVCPLTGTTEAEPTCIELPPVVVRVSPPPAGAATGAGALTGAGAGAGVGEGAGAGAGAGAGDGVLVVGAVAPDELVLVVEEPPLLVTTVTGVDGVVVLVDGVDEAEVTSNASTHTQDPAEFAFFVPVASIARVWDPAVNPDTEYRLA
jgi:hypothetical protein